MRKQKKSEPYNQDEVNIKRLEDVLTEAEVKQFDADAELWDTGKLGGSAKHAKLASDAQEKALDSALSLQLFSIRLQKSLVDNLRELAKLEGIGYQTFMRQILTNYVHQNEHKLECVLTPSQSVDKAEQLFAQALKYKEIIPTLKPLSNERIGAESDYTLALGQANDLFCQAYGNCQNPVLKRHLNLRMNQIGELCGEKIQEFSNKKYKKAG